MDNFCTPFVGHVSPLAECDISSDVQLIDVLCALYFLVLGRLF